MQTNSDFEKYLNALNKIYREELDDYIDKVALSVGAAIINGGIKTWDFLKPINSNEYFNKNENGENTIVWITDNVLADENPMNKCLDTKVILIKSGADNLMDLVPALEIIIAQNKTFIIITCEPCSQELIQALLLNAVRGSLKGVLILLPDNVGKQSEMLSRISEVTEAKIFQTANAVSKVTERDIGTAHEFFICGERALFVATPDLLSRNKKIPELKKTRESIAKFQNRIYSSHGHSIGLKADGTIAIGSKCEKYHDMSTNSWRDIVAISTSVMHWVGLRANGTVVANGDNNVGIKDWRDIVAISAGDRYTVGLKNDGTVLTVGVDCYGRCNIEGWRDIVAISAGERYTVGIKANGTVVAVGKNENGLCNIEDWGNIVAISVFESILDMFDGMVGLKTDGTVVTVGDNWYGRFNTWNWRDIVAISTNEKHTVGLRADGTVVAVGENEDGQCNTENWSDIVAISAGSKHTIGLKADGTVVAVGNKKDGLCDVKSWRDIIAISTYRDRRTAGLKRDGTIVEIGVDGFDW